MSQIDDPDRTESRLAPRRAEPAEIPARLRMVYPPDLQWSMALGSESNVLGRHGVGDCPPLAHPTVSREHLRIDWNPAVRGHVATDLGSRNGSNVNGTANPKRIHLSDGAVVQLGDVLSVYECGRGLAMDDADHVSRDHIPGDSPAIRAVRDVVGRAAPDPSPVLLIGETGTGKEWIAKELHRLSKRKGRFLAVNCATLSPHIIDSQLFGHVKGAFSGATNDHEGWFRAADLGTLFLDEIGELPLALQPKLLRVLQDGQLQPVGSTRTITVDVRVLAATNRNLSESVDSDQFRRDLYARLSMWEVRVPPLRERRGDILGWLELLHAHWSAERRQQERLVFAPDCALALTRYEWPNNLRDVNRVVHELGSTCSGDMVTPQQLPDWMAKPMTPPPGRAAPTKEEFLQVSEQLNGNISAIARHFGRDRRQIYRWRDAFGLNKS